MKSVYKYLIGYCLGVLTSFCGFRIHLNRSIKTDIVNTKKEKDDYENDKDAYRGIANRYRPPIDSVGLSDRIHKQDYKTTDDSESISTHIQSEPSMVSEQEVDENDIPDDLVLTPEPKEGGMYHEISATDYNVAKFEGKTIQEIEYSISENSFYCIKTVNFKTERIKISHRSIRALVGVGLYKIFIDRANESNLAMIYVYNEIDDIHVLIAAYD